MKYLYLKQKNLHERDSQLFFDEDLHQYNYNDKVLTSVTTVISEFFPVFDADNVIQKNETEQSKLEKK